MCKRKGLRMLVPLQGLCCRPASLSLCLFFLSVLCFSIQRGTSASLPKPNTVGSASRLGLNVAGVKTRYVKENDDFLALRCTVKQVCYNGVVLHRLMHSEFLKCINQVISLSFSIPKPIGLLRSKSRKILMLKNE